MAKKFAMNFGEMQQKIEANQSGSKKEKDLRFYAMQFKDTGTFNSIIRFLPQKDVSKIPYVDYYHHGFKVGNSWYINNCPTTIQSKCPVCESNSEHWNNGDEATAKERKRKRSYVANILVVKDNQNPENNGKVFLFKFGVKIFEKIQAFLKPEDGSDPINVFDYYEGCNFKLNAKKTDQGPNYDTAAFSDIQTALCDGNDEEIEKINELSFDLDEFISASAFKSYDDLKKRFDEVTGNSSKSSFTKSEDKKETPKADSETKEDEKPQIKTETSKKDFLASLVKSQK